MYWRNSETVLPPLLRTLAKLTSSTITSTREMRTQSNNIRGAFPWHYRSRQIGCAKNGSVCHYRINVTPDKNYYVAENYVFDSIPKMIQYHSHNSGGNWELNKKEISLLKELGSGQFGVVHLGLWKDQYEVAIKVIKEGSMSEDDFIEEAKIMM
ncbi:BMX kinase, partial [Polypterus senegalus]